MQNQLQFAATIAFIQEAHQGQTYGKLPYYLHPVEVADEVEEMVESAMWQAGAGNPVLTETAILAALLHDVLEDTKYTAEELLEFWDSKVVDIVKLATLNPELEYLDNIQAIIDSGNIGAMMVKLADNRVNRRGDKSQFKPEKAQRLNDRYDASIKMLTDELTKLGFMIL